VTEGRGACGCERKRTSLAGNVGKVSSVVHIKLCVDACGRQYDQNVEGNDDGDDDGDGSGEGAAGAVDAHGERAHAVHAVHVPAHDHEEGVPVGGLRGWGGERERADAQGRGNKCHMSHVNKSHGHESNHPPRLSIHCL